MCDRDWRKELCRSIGADERIADAWSYVTPTHPRDNDIEWNAGDCLGRSKTALGSSVGYAASTNLGGGYFSNDPAVNPMMCVGARVCVWFS